MPDLTTQAVLTHNFMFRGLPASTIDGLCEISHRKSFAKDSMVFRQGDDGDALYGIASGSIRIFASDLGGNEIFLNILGPGDTFGEIALVDGLPRTASALVVEKSTLVVIPRHRFLAYLESHPDLAIHLMKLMCERLRWVSDLVEESMFLTGPARLAKRLVSLAEIHGRPGSDGDIEVSMSQSELSHFLGISRQIVNQYLNTWSDEGLVSLRRGHIAIRDMEKLKNIPYLSTF